MENLQPKLRFPEFKEEWKMYFISDFFKVGSSKRVKQEDWKTEGIPFYRTRELVKLSKNEKIENEIFISEEHYNDLKSKYGVPKIGDLLISGVGTLGISYVVTNNNPFYIKDGNVLWFNKVKNINSLFFNYNFKTRFLLSQILNNASATTVGTYTIDNAKKTKFFCTEIQEQTKIADFLSSVDKQLDILNQKKEKLNLYKKGTMQQLFSQQIRFKDDNGNDFPDWEDTKIGEVCQIKRGASPRPISNPKWFDENSKIGWVRISDVTKSKNILQTTTQYLSEEGISKSRLVKKDNLIMSICATIGKPIYTGFDVCIHDGFVVFENLNCVHQYLFYYLDFIQEKWYKYGQPGTQINLNSTIVSDEYFPLPKSLAEQTKIANFLSVIDTQIEAVENHITKTETYKKGLLQQMFV
ncbi:MULTISPECIES: restriction endonuclease subunit S [unclassified Myroides]|uniref:restriction endonuclease subunit S n=1 Tax=unclassified Myroides TaxID=2642485 RepID=UPI003D2F6BC3